MKFFLSNFKWVMLISGILTCTMFVGLISPQSSLRSNFGVIIEDPAVDIVVRSWSALVGLMGVMLIYGAFVPAVRKFYLVVVCVSKLIFVLLIFLLGCSFMKFGIGTAAIVDSVMVLLFVVYLLFSSSTVNQR